MSTTDAFADVTANICVAALGFAGAGAAGIVPFLAPLAKLAAMGFDFRQGQLKRCVNTASAHTMKALKDAPELAGANFERASLLLGNVRAKVDLDPEYMRAARTVGADGLRGYLVEGLMRSVAFEKDDHLERRAVHIAFEAAIVCLLADPDMQRDLTRDAILDTARDQGLILSHLERIAIGLADIHAIVSGLGGSSAVPAEMSMTSASHFAITEPNTVIVGWSETSPGWWERTGGSLRSALDKLSSAGALVPQPWDFSALEYNPALHEHAKSVLWQALSSPSSMHAATIVYLGNSLGMALATETNFERRLAKHGFLAQVVGDRGFVNTKALQSAGRLAMLDGGAIPITPETRLILETLLAGRPLLVWSGGDGATRDHEVTTLLDWLEDREVMICGGIAAADDRWAQAFLARVFDIDAGQLPNPYRKLDHYLLSDAGNYYGRDAEADQAQAWLKKALEHSGTRYLRVGGGSGVGKSSFLNARVAPLGQQAGLTFVTFRPTDFEPRPNMVFSPIREFCQLVASVVGPRSRLQEYPQIDLQDLPRAAASAVLWLQELRSSGIRLLVGVDQFEEILDNIYNGWNREAWHSLITMFAALAETAESLICFTLETSRESILAEEFGGTPFAKAPAIVLRDNDEVFLRKIIMQPFADVGLHLGEDIVVGLVKETRLHQDEIGRNSSSLPLLALKLYGLFAHLSGHRLARSATATVFGGAVREITLADLDGYSLSIAEEIGNLADQAWTDTGGGGLDDLDTFLRPYLRVIPVENSKTGRIVLQAVPARSFYTVASRQAAFIKRRLVVPTAAGFRLVHESVIRRWSFANGWFERERASLLRQAAMAMEALNWAARGRLALDAPDADDIATAARILGAFITDWIDSDLPDAVAIERGYCLALFNHAIDPRAEVEASPNGNLFIHLAASYDQVDLLTRFLDKDPEAAELPRRDGRTPIASAAWLAPRAVALLLERNANPNSADEQGFGAIDAAVWGGNQYTFDLLLPHLDPLLASDQRCNPLYGAARQARHGMMDRLEARGFRHDMPTRGGHTPLIGAAMGRDQAMFERCLAKGDPLLRSAEGANTVDILASNGALDLLQRLITHPKAVEALLPNPETGKTALMWASQALMPKTVIYLLRLGIPPNVTITTGPEQGRTAVHFCLDWFHRHGDRAPRFVVEKTRATLEALLDVTAIDVSLAAENGDTAYSMAQHNQDLRDLIASHPSFQPSALPTSIATPLDRAIARKDRELIEELLAESRHLAVVDRVDDGGITPALAMIRRGFSDIAARLIRAGHVDPWRETANYSGLLYTACAERATEVADLIIARMPEHLSATQLASIVSCKSANRSDFKPSEFDADNVIIEKALAGVEAPGLLGFALGRAGELGNVELFLRLARAGADVWQKDAWDRNVIQRSADCIELSPDVAAFAALKNGRRVWNSAQRAALAAGDMDAIAALLDTTRGQPIIDDWRRDPADLVPNLYQDSVRALLLKRNEEGP